MQNETLSAQLSNVVKNEIDPCNLIRAPFEHLISNKYKLLGRGAHWRNGDLMCLVNTSKDLWAIVDNIRKFYREGTEPKVGDMIGMRRK